MFWPSWRFAKPIICLFLNIFRPSLRQSIQPLKCQFFIRRHAQENVKGLVFLFHFLLIKEGRIGRKNILNSTGIPISQEGFLTSLTIEITITRQMIHLTLEDFNYYTIYLLSEVYNSKRQRYLRIFKWLRIKKGVLIFASCSEIEWWSFLRLEMSIVYVRYS